MGELKRRWMKRLLAFAVLATLCTGIAAWVVGSYLCAPSPARIVAPQRLPVEAVEIPSESGSTLRGWVIDQKTSRGVVVLMHGVRGNRLGMVERARFLTGANYSVLLFDFQAHGESPGNHITSGYLESRDARATVEFARKRFPTKPIAVIGGSLGGAAALLASPPLEVQALVLESVYPTITEAIEDRMEMKLGEMGRWLAPLLTWQIKPRLGCRVDDLSPIRQVATIKVPKLFIAGTEDRHTKITEAREMFRQAAEPKTLWEVNGASHVDLHHFVGKPYEERILAFLSQHLHEN
jgi:alpha-beta hydrolase superfamily lysophospholipase